MIFNCKNFLSHELHISEAFFGSIIRQKNVVFICRRFLYMSLFHGYCDVTLEVANAFPAKKWTCADFGINFIDFRYVYKNAFTI